MERDGASAVSKLHDALEGSPYSIPSDGPSEERAAFLVKRLAEIEERCAAVDLVLRTQALPQLKQNQRVREIFESNAIEGLGLSLSETAKVILRQEADGVQTALSRYTMRRVLADEPKVQDVLGLHGARLLADDIVREQDRPISETDIRNLHSLILQSHEGAGRYKIYVNWIEGSRHEPMLPTDTPGHMADLAAWFSEATAPPLLRATVVHAWLTHIHPFEDGNGRMARLLANMALSRSQWPPLIIKSSSDRGRYIDALAHSDAAGDLLPLIALFTRVVNRALTEFEDPSLALTLFELDVRSRGTDVFEWWQYQFDWLLRNLMAEAPTVALEVQQIGSLAPSDFELLRRLNPTGNSWIAEIRSLRSDLQLLLWLGFPSAPVRRTLEEDEFYPSIFFSTRDRSPRPAKPYVQIGTHVGFPIDEATLILGSPTRVYLRGGKQLHAVSVDHARQLLVAAFSQWESRQRDRGEITPTR